MMIRPLFTVMLLCLSGPSWAATYYVATTGNDTTGNGSIGTPWRTCTKAMANIAAGDTVYFRGGTYQEYCTETANGTSGSRITLATYPGETAIFDGSGISAGTNSFLLRINGDYVTLRGLEVKNAAWMSVILWSTSTDCIVENMVIHDSYRNGIAIYRSPNAIVRNNLVYNTYDFNQGGGNADCIDTADDGAKWTSNAQILNNIVHDCSDDGIDMWQGSGNTIRGNLSYHNGFVPGTSTSAGDGNGYKLGSGGSNTVVDNIAWNNRSRGFDDNTGTNNLLYNNTAINNASENFRMTASGGVLRNNISTGTVGNISGQTLSNNSWTLGLTATYVQITDATLSTFGTIAAGSTTIDAGAAISGYTYNGSAPDLGAHETITHSSCVVENATPSTMSITFNNARHSPLLPASPAFGTNAFTSRINGGNNVVTAASTSTNTISLTLTTPVANGNAIDYSYSTTSGNVTDSSNVGGTYQRLNAITNQSCTNNVNVAATNTRHFSPLLNIQR